MLATLARPSRIVVILLWCPTFQEHQKLRSMLHHPPPLLPNQGRMRRSSLELHTGPVAVSSCYPDTVPGPFSATFDQDALTSILLSASAAAAAAAQNGFMQDPVAASAAAAAAGFPGKQPQVPYLASTGTATAAGTDSFDASLLESEEPGPLPVLPRTRALGSGGPYGSSSAALMMHHQPQQQGSYEGGGGGRQGRPRRHSVTIGMLNEHQQQQQQAAYAAALAAAQQAGISMPGPAPAGMGMLGQMQQPQQPPPQGSASPAKQQLQALNNMQNMAAAAQLGMGANSLLASLGLQHSEQLQQQLAAASMPMGMGDLGAQYSMNAPRMPNAGGCRRHSWAPTGANGSNPYAQALLLQQQRQFAAAAAMAQDPRGLMGGMMGLNGMNGINGVNGMNGLGLKQKGFGPAGAPRAPAVYANGNGYLNGHTPAANGPLSGSYAGLPAAAAAAAAAMVQLTSLQSVGALATGLDPISEQQLTRLLQLQQQSDLTAGQPALDPYMEGVLEAGQALGPPNPALLPSLAPVAGAALAPGLLPPAAAATTALTQLGFDVDSLSPAAAAAAASMYAPLQINGVTLDSQLLVAPFADNWDVMCAQGGQAGVTPQQLAAVAAGLSAAQAGFGVMSPRAAGGAANGMAAPASAPHNKHHKGLPARSGSCGSNSSNGSNGYSTSASGPLSSVPLGHVSNGRSSATAAAGSGGGSAAAALAAASVAASVPPIANVCSDSPWDLKKAAEEDAKVLAAQQGRVQRLVAALEKSETLAKVRAAQAAGGGADAASSSDAADNSKGASERMQPVLFGYQLPDTGADAWGGSSAAVENAPGSGCISQEPSNKLFVGNIGWWVTEDDLLHWFSRFGNVVHVKVRPGALRAVGSCNCCQVLYLFWFRLMCSGLACLGGCSPSPLRSSFTSVQGQLADSRAFRRVCLLCRSDHVQLAQDAQAQGQVAQPGVRLHRLCHTRGGSQGDCVDGRRGAA